MNGAGTQDRPYIAYTWDDFVEVLGETDAYGKFADEVLIDMNNVAPEGIDYEIPINCKSFDGCGAVIQNAYFLNTGNTFTYHTAAEISNLNLLDFRTHSRCFIDVNFPTTLYRCRFSGFVYSESLFFTRDLVLLGCGLNLNLNGTALCEHSYTERLNFSNCNMKFSGTSKRSIITLTNSLIQGICPSIFITDGRDSIINAVTNDNVQSNYLRNILINTDMIQGSEGVPNGLIGVNTDQLRSASYLASIGFPIATAETMRKSIILDKICTLLGIDSLPTNEADIKLLVAKIESLAEIQPLIGGD